MKNALFLDRDGVIIRDAGYVKDVGQVRLIEGCPALIRQAREKGWLVVVVTNQSGLGRGWIRLDDYGKVSERMIELLALQGVELDAIYFAPFYAGAGESPYPAADFVFATKGITQSGKWASEWRKPEAGMLRQAASDLGIDLPSSLMVGDRHTDILAAQAAGLRRFVFLQSEISAEEQGMLAAHPLRIQVEQVTDLSEVRL